MASLFDAYVAGGAREFFDGAPADAADRARAVERARARPIGADVMRALEAQNLAYGPSAARTANLSALAHGAAAVVTGQQVGLFLGPLYTLYKAASAIRIARALAAQTGRPVVPLFWLQTEDHDLVEIASCAIPRADREPLALSVPVAADNRVSIAHLSLPPEVDACLTTLDAELSNLPHARAHLERLQRHYRPGARYGAAFAGLLAELFEPEGLLLLDPRDPAIAPAASAVHREALSSAAALAQALLERCHALAGAGFESSVHVREAAPLSFFHAGGAGAPRHRLAPCAEGFSEVGGERTFGAAALLAALESDPLCFSTSALLRPILQDRLLPTAAYVGGPGEIAYFAQLGPLYRAFDLPMPLVVPRARLRVVEAATARLLAKLGLSADALAQNTDALLAQLARRQPAGRPAPAAFERALADGFERVLHDALAQIGPLADQLRTPIEKTRGKVGEAVHRLAEKYQDAVTRGDQALVHDVQRLKQLLYPRDTPQERFYGLPYFAARYGDRAFAELVLEAIDPFDFAVKELRP